MKSAVEVLTEAQALIARPNGWCKGDLTKATPGGMSYCALGAVFAVAGFETRESHAAEVFLREAAGTDYVGDWNDAHTKREVLNLYGRAIELASLPKAKEGKQ